MPKEQYFKIVKEGIARNPDFYSIYFEAAYFLDSRWYGAPGEKENVFDEPNAISWKRTRRGFEVLQKKYPDSTFTTAEYLRFAIEQNDEDAIQIAVSRLKPQFAS